ncbi:MAG: NUDIX hydrolase [Nitrospirales bacterium]|nr:NUDIX hydrolase [Nitrospirales bacterium]
MRHLHSAGGVIFRMQDGIPEVALIATKGGAVWTLPKGIIDKGEVAETAAVREIEEETGLRGKVREILGEKSYWFYQKEENVKFRKTVTYFLLEYQKGEIRGSCWEVDDARWIPVSDAATMVSYKSDREILAEAKERLCKPVASSGQRES